MTENKKPSWAKRVAAGATIATAVAADPASAQSAGVPVPAQDISQMQMNGSVRHIPPENYGGSLGAILIGAGLWIARRPRRNGPGQENSR